MASNEKFTDDLIHQLVCTAIVLKLENNFTPAVAEVLSESKMLGSIIAQYFKNTGRRIAETAYATFDAAGLTVEHLPFPSSGAGATLKKTTYGQQRRMILKVSMMITEDPSRFVNVLSNSGGGAT